MNTSSDAGRGIPAFAGMTGETRTTGTTMENRDNGSDRNDDEDKDYGIHADDNEDKHYGSHADDDEDKHYGSHGNDDGRDKEDGSWACEL